MVSPQKVSGETKVSDAYLRWQAFVLEEGLWELYLGWYACLPFWAHFGIA